MLCNTTLHFPLRQSVDPSGLPPTVATENAGVFGKTYDWEDHRLGPPDFEIWTFEQLDRCRLGRFLAVPRIPPLFDAWKPGEPQDSRIIVEKFKSLAFKSPHELLKTMFEGLLTSLLISNMNEGRWLFVRRFRKLLRADESGGEL